VSERYTVKRWNNAGSYSSASFSNSFAAFREFGSTASNLATRVEMWCHSLDGVSLLVAVYDKGGIRENQKGQDRRAHSVALP
jgi:hypothetical protein